MKAQVLLPKIFNHPFTYNSKNLIKVGDFVEVPFGKRKEIGVVWPGKSPELKNIKLKNINKKIYNFSLNQDLINFINWFATYNMMPLGLVLKMIIGKSLSLKKKTDQDFNQSKQKIKKIVLNEEQKKALKFLNFKNNNFTVSVLQGITGSGKTLVYFERIKKIIKKKEASISFTT